MLILPKFICVVILVMIVTGVNKGLKKYIVRHETSNEKNLKRTKKCGLVGQITVDHKAVEINSVKSWFMSE